MGQGTDMNEKLLSNQGFFLFAHRNHLIAFSPLSLSWKNLNQQHKTVSSNPRITISSLNPANEMCQSDESSTIP